MDQQYEQYTPADQQMWEKLYKRQMEILPSIASNAYLEGIGKVGFVADHIPHFVSETNPALKRLTGWEVYAVPGLIPHQEFYSHLFHRRFPATNWLRTPLQQDYLEEPDLFHDSFGHVPLLSNAEFCVFMEHLSGVALQFIEQEDALQRLSRLYWYTVEFGLIREEGALKIFGGGILSSAGESLYCLNPEIPKYDFDLERVLETPYHIDHYQDHYFVIDSYDQLYQSIQDLEGHLRSYANG
ncbi:phenylalanine-4-hydroxylase [Dyadobacter jejuensis]|uniref:phenylalanine 4-monooxygenase n=1 Tax=Dyadobacter jejuensis TaxID=1082580 RepID=A0A316ATE2_9BACT|nr:phenylalanine 4-monooxygenase [Dyadobacter jejuensis]PWJ60000.1 phenylalanine-4-hydroxylase [Dyadobacter jejuensis]